MASIQQNILLHDHSRIPINYQRNMTKNVGRLIRYYKLATKSYIYANFSHCLKPINDQINMTKFWSYYKIL